MPVCTAGQRAQKTSIMMPKNKTKRRTGIPAVAPQISTSLGTNMAKDKDKDTAKPKKAKLSDSRALVHTGPKEVVVKKNGTKRDENGLLPSDNRALILRNGKYGSQGTGEIVLSSRPRGREKLDLLAGTLEYQSQLHICD